jgi:beta-1,4-galactosyltransferase 1
MNLNFIIPYRSCNNQVFRKQELENLILNINQLTEINKSFKFNIYIIEQYNTDLFNRGALLNIGFIESYNHHYNDECIYIHCNTDYHIPIDILPNIFNKKPNGFIDIHGFPSATLGGFVLFDAQSYISSNGFPNNIYGWGGEDWGIWKRILKRKIHVSRPPQLYNKWIIENENHPRDRSNNRMNSYKAKNIDDILSNGLNTTSYMVDSCDIHHNIVWYKVNFNFKDK